MKNNKQKPKKSETTQNLFYSGLNLILIVPFILLIMTNIACMFSSCSMGKGMGFVIIQVYLTTASVGTGVVLLLCSLVSYIKQKNNTSASKNKNKS